MQVNIHEAKTHLSRLVDRAIEGEEITIAKDGVPAVRLVPVPQTKLKRPLGIDRDSIWIADDFDARVFVNDTTALSSSSIGTT